MAYEFTVSGRIAKPVHEVFEAVADPASLSGYFTTGGTMWLQPVNEFIGVYGLSLTTSGGGGGGAMISNWNNKCIDVPSSNFADRAPLQMWNCNNTNAQKWTFTGTALKSQNDKCMDIDAGSTANGAVVQLYTCNGTGAQKWRKG